MTQTRSDMAAYIRERTGCTKKDAEQSAFLAVEWLLNAVASGVRVELRGFGSFFIEEKPEHRSNLNGGILVPKRGVIKFRPAEALVRESGISRNLQEKA